MPLAEDVKTQICAVDHIPDRGTNVDNSLELEGAMRTMSLHIAGRQRRLRWNQVKKGLIEWQHRARSRRDLMNLSDVELRDIGITRCTAGYEASKPFWMA